MSCRQVQLTGQANHQIRERPVGLDAQLHAHHAATQTGVDPPNAPGYTPDSPILPPSRRVRRWPED